MITVITYLLMFACGAFTKFADNLIDEPFKSKFPWLQYATAAIYGILAGYLATGSTEFATLIIAITIGVLFAGKIDSKAHQLAIAIIFVTIALRGLPSIDILLLAALVILGFLDDALNDFVDNAKEKGKHINSTIRHIVSARLSLEIGTLALGLWTGNFVYFLSIFSFDLAYNIVDKAMPLFMKMFNPEYGPQLVVDLYKCNAKKLGDKNFIKKTLVEFPAKIGMRKISKAFVFKYNPKNKEEQGLSAFVLIAESHITIHTYPLRQLAKIDIVSCKGFDQEKAAAMLKKTFNAKEAEAKSLYRGKHYPKDLKKSAELAKKERSKSTVCKTQATMLKE